MNHATRLIALTAILPIATPAYAHLGHVGEVAGHGHWIGLAAASAAAAIAIAVSALGRKKGDESRGGQEDAGPEDGGTQSDEAASKA